MQFIYNIGIYFTDFVLKIVALFNAKIKLGVKGRQLTFKTLEQHLEKNTKTLWFHCASLGEYEQGLPVFEKLRQIYPKHKIVLSFFSPSGYEIRKNSPIADIVVYLSLDSKKNAKRFINLVRPELTIFVKYDIWPNYLNALKESHFKAILISAVFRPKQVYFKPYGKLFTKALFTFDHIFTQNKTSKELLHSIGYNSVTVSGDTRFDRVSAQLETDNTLDFIEIFKDNKLCVIVGSSWPEDETLFIEYINSTNVSNVKFIVAPHNIKTKQIANFISKLNKPSILYSEKDKKTLSDFKVLVIDTIGLLSKIYHYADIAYVGGAMGTTGLHNTLEPAVFGVPIIIGPNYKNFPEAHDLIANGGMFSVSNQNQFNKTLKTLIENSDYRETSGAKNSRYINRNKGAVIQILDYLRI